MEQLITQFAGQGLLGLVTAASLYVAMRLYGKLEEVRAQHLVDMEARDKAHKMELAEWIKLYTASTEQRISETALHADRMANANNLLANSAFNRGGPRLEQTA